MAQQFSHSSLDFAGCDMREPKTTDTQMYFLFRNATVKPWCKKGKKLACYAFCSLKSFFLATGATTLTICRVVAQGQRRLSKLFVPIF